MHAPFQIDFVSPCPRSSLAITPTISQPTLKLIELYKSTSALRFHSKTNVIALLISKQMGGINNRSGLRPPLFQAAVRENCRIPAENLHLRSNRCLC
jgi:hypothetical protein